MTDGKIVAVFVGLIRPPRRFAIQRRIGANREVFELFKPNSLREFVSQLLIALSSTSPDFMSKLARLDDEQFQRSKHKSRRYIVEHRELLYIGSPHLTEKHSEQVLGFWIATNLGRKEVGAITGLACQAAGVKRESISRAQL